MYTPQINASSQPPICAGIGDFRDYGKQHYAPLWVHVLQIPHLTATFAAQRSYSLANGGRNYFADVVGIHMALGLAVTYQDAVAIAYLTPKKEYEVMVLAPTLNDNFARLLVCTRQANACRQMDDALPTFGIARPVVPPRARTTVLLSIVAKLLKPLYIFGLTRYHYCRSTKW
jgi:hypothetical protein